MAPLLVVVPAWLVGIFVYSWLQPALLWLVIGALGGTVLTVGAFFYNRRYSYLPGRAVSLVLPLCLLAFCLGGLRTAWAEPSRGPDGLIYYTGKGEVKLVGMVSGDPVYTESSGTYRLEVREVYYPANAPNSVPVSGDLFVRGPALPKREAGDLLEISGKLEEPKEITGDGFPYRDWLARQGIFATLSYPTSKLLAAEQDFVGLRWLRAIKNSAQETLLRFVPDREGGLLVGMLLGDRSGIDSNLNKAFQATGTSHIIAISGSNITIAINLVTMVLGRFYKKKTVLAIALPIILFYVVLVGASPSVVRAGIMGAFMIVGFLFGRESEGLLGLEASALIMTVAQPRVLWDIGFELSFLATLGLIIIARPMQEWKVVKDWPPLLKEGLLVTFAAEVMVLPLVAFYFHQVSFVSLAANLMAVPALEAIMATGLIAVAVGWLFSGWLPVLASFFGYLTWIFLAYLIAVVEFFAALPFASATLPAFHPIWLFNYYLVLGLVLWFWRDSHKRWYSIMARASASPLIYGGTALLAVAAWAAVFFL